MKDRSTFGPPRNAVGAFVWAVLQLPRAVVWTVRECELRGLVFAPALLTFGLGALGCAVAVVAAGPLQALVMEHSTGLFGGVAWVAARVLITVVLVVGALLGAWQLQGGLAAASLERMALHVQRDVLGDAPAPATDAKAVVKRAVLGVFPTVRRLVLWALTALAGLTLVLVPVVGPVLVVVAQTAIGALFLAHGAITDNRDRLGLPRRLLLREPALLLGYALACAPLMLFPPALLFLSGPVTVGGALVALGAHRRRLEAGSAHAAAAAP
ncbi:MAG: hypothetical protein JNJ54_19035 [Myxococcaceae bacterium]|nr:hypothetical protein [Myxococcaceae bacterium]